MDADRQSFIIYKNFYEPIKHLDDVDLGKLFRAIFEYNLTGDGMDKLNGYAVPPEVKIPFEFFRNQFNLDEAKWLKRVEASRENGLKGGRPPEPKEPTGLSRLETEPRKGDTVTDTVTGTGTETETEKDLKEIQKKAEIKIKLLDSFYSPVYSDQFETWWVNWKSKSRDNPGTKNQAEKHWKVLNKKLSAEQIQKSTDIHLKATGRFHKAAENFLNPAHGLVQQWLDFTPPPKPSAESERSAPIEISFKNQRDSVRRNLANMNKLQAEEEWEKLPESWRTDVVIQKMFKNKC